MERLIDRNSNSENELEGFGDGKPLTSVDEFADDDVDDVEDDEFENEDKIIVFDVEKSARSVVGILKPVSFTMALVVWMVRLLHVITKDVE
jgi:hypothetical protein